MGSMPLLAQHGSRPIQVISHAALDPRPAHSLTHKFMSYAHLPVTTHHTHFDPTSDLLHPHACRAVSRSNCMTIPASSKALVTNRLPAGP